MPDGIICRPESADGRGDATKGPGDTRLKGIAEGGVPGVRCGGSVDFSDARAWCEWRGQRQRVDDDETAIL